jgi:hypothetical protein
MGKRHLGGEWMARWLPFSLLLALLVSFAILPATASPDIPQQIVDLVNAARAQEGLPPLTLESCLTRASQGHSDDMATHNFFSHIGSDGSTPWDRMHREGYDYVTAGEAIAGGQTSPGQAVEDWLNSPPHHLLLMGNYRDIGVGYASSDAGLRFYWTVDLGTTRNTPTPRPPTPTPANATPQPSTPRPPTPTATPDDYPPPRPTRDPRATPIPTRTPGAVGANSFEFYLPIASTFWISTSPSPAGVLSSSRWPDSTD